MKREKKRKEKEAKKLARAENKNSLDDDSMIAYVDQYGNITDTPPDPEEREEINAEDIELGIPKKEKIEGDEIREGIVSFFNHDKGFGFIRDLGSGETFLTRSTVTSDKTMELDGVEYPVIDVEISSSSHPFYTGKQRIMDSAGRVEKFNQRFKNFGSK